MQEAKSTEIQLDQFLWTDEAEAPISLSLVQSKLVKNPEAKVAQHPASKVVTITLPNEEVLTGTPLVASKNNNNQKEIAADDDNSLARIPKFKEVVSIKNIKKVLGKRHRSDVESDIEDDDDEENVHQDTYHNHYIKLIQAATNRISEVGLRSLPVLRSLDRSWINKTEKSVISRSLNYHYLTDLPRAVLYTVIQNRRDRLVSKIKRLVDQRVLEYLNILEDDCRIYLDALKASPQATGLAIRNLINSSQPMNITSSIRNNFNAAIAGASSSLVAYDLAMGFQLKPVCTSEDYCVHSKKIPCINKRPKSKNFKPRGRGRGRGKTRGRGRGASPEESN